MGDKAAFDTYLRLLRRVVALRGGDPDAEAARFHWPAGVADNAGPPRAAISLSPLLTGGPEPGDANTASHTGVAAVPTGLGSPES